MRLKYYFSGELMSQQNDFKHYNTHLIATQSHMIDIIFDATP